MPEAAKPTTVEPQIMTAPQRRSHALTTFWGSFPLLPASHHPNQLRSIKPKANHFADTESSSPQKVTFVPEYYCIDPLLAAMTPEGAPPLPPRPPPKPPPRPPPKPPPRPPPKPPPRPPPKPPPRPPPKPPPRPPPKPPPRPPPPPRFLFG